MNRVGTIFSFNTIYRVPKIAKPYFFNNAVGLFAADTLSISVSIPTVINLKVSNHRINTNKYFFTIVDKTGKGATIIYSRLSFNNTRSIFVGCFLNAERVKTFIMYFAIQTRFKP